MQWIFTRKSASTKTRDPISGEYFSSDAIEDAGQALVREAIQNSIDATVPPGPVRIRIFVSGDEHALPSNRHRRWFDGVWPHDAAKNNGLKSGCDCRMGRMVNLQTYRSRAEALMGARVEACSLLAVLSVIAL
jgi:hypothetical protein